jgi:hypothetical protein
MPVGSYHMLMVLAEVKKLILSKLSQQIKIFKQHSQQKLIEPLQQSMKQLQQSCNRGSSLQAH